MGLLQNIDAGKYDDHLQAIIDAAFERRKFLRSVKAEELRRSLKPGDLVIITMPIKPKYLAGWGGTIIPTPPGGKERPGYIWVDIEQKVNRYGPRVLVPLTCLKKVGN
jgi:hypothetical protein